MAIFIQTFIDGLANGSIYASLALALVLVHRASHVPNFAQGDMAMVSAFIAWEFQDRFGSSVIAWVGGFTVAIVLSFLMGFVIERGVIRWVENSSLLTLLIVTLGLTTIINNGAGAYWGFLPKRMQSPFPSKPIRVADVVLSWQLIGIILVLVVMMVLVFGLFKYTKLGLGLRGAAGSPASARLVGINVGLMLAVGWGLAAAVGASAGVMVAPQVGLQPNMMASILLFAFAGAVLGGFDSPPGAVIGGLLIGLLQSFTATYWVPHGSQLSLVIAFVVILVVLLVRPNGLFGRAQVTRV